MLSTKKIQYFNSFISILETSHISYGCTTPIYLIILYDYWVERTLGIPTLPFDLYDSVDLEMPETCGCMDALWILLQASERITVGLEAGPCPFWWKATLLLKNSS